jgi:pyrroline-5-carboxylate reductase
VASRAHRPESVSVIGGGHLGQALVAMLIERQGLNPSKIHVIDPNAQKLEFFKKRFHCNVCSSLQLKHVDATTILLAIKPQSIGALRGAVSALGEVAEPSLVVSFLAGVRLLQIREIFQKSPLARAMCNLAIAHGEGVSVFTFDRRVNSQLDSQCFLDVMGRSGACFELDSEELLDASTALIGSGPAFIFYLAEACLEAAQSLGFSADLARQVIPKVFTGAVKLWVEEGGDPGVLRSKVTSKEGTTAAGIGEFESRSVKEALVAGIERAAKRAKELGER